MKPLTYFVVRSSKSPVIDGVRAWRESSNSNAFSNFEKAYIAAMDWAGRHGASYRVYQVTLIGEAGPAAPPVKWELPTEGETDESVSN